MRLPPLLMDPHPPEATFPPARRRASSTFYLRASSLAWKHNAQEIRAHRQYVDEEPS
jgi:hypothetical protein